MITFTQVYRTDGAQWNQPMVHLEQVELAVQVVLAGVVVLLEQVELAGQVHKENK